MNTVIIIVEGGLVQTVVSTEEPVTYRLIDLDNDAGDPEVDYTDTTDVIANEGEFVATWKA